MARLSSPVRLLALNVGLALAYAVIGTLALLTVRDTGLAAPVWPSAGLAFAMVYQFGWRVAPGVAVGSFLVNAPAVGASDTLSVAIGVGVVIAAGAAAQAIVGAVLVRRAVGSTPSLTMPRSILAFLLLAGPLACVVNPTVGLAAQLWGEVIAPEQAGITWLTWWVGDAIGVIVTAPLILMLLPQQRAAWRGRRVAVAVPSLIVLVVCSWAFLRTAQSEIDANAARVAATAREAATSLELDLQRQAEAVQGIGAFVAASDYISRGEFERYTRDILEREPSLQGLSWNPVVPLGERAAFEQRQQEQEGLVGYTVTERDSEGATVPAAPRDRYVAVQYIEPVASNSAALGFDILSNPVRAAAVDAAVDSGRLRATAPVSLVIGQGEGGPGVLLMDPVFADGSDPESPTARALALTGVAVGVYLTQQLADQVFSGPQWQGLGLTLTDVTPGEAPSRLATIPMVGSPAPLDPVRVYIDVAGRTWALDLTVPRSSGLWSPPTTSPALLVGGLIIVVLLEAFLLLVTGNERRARREAEEHGYQANHDSLTDLSNRRAFLTMLDRARERADEEASRHVLLLMDLDGFKAVNDSSGHAAGDAMLREVARVLRANVRERDVVARIGGDEFAALLNNCPQDRGMRIAEAMVEGVGALRLDEPDDAPGVGLSVGLAMVDGAAPASVDELMRRADVACYGAKRSGGRTVRVFAAEPDRSRGGA